jgi:hypothetical protein
MAEPNGQNGNEQPTPDPSEERTGGSGGVPQVPKRFVSDANMAARFPIRPEARQAVADAMLKIILSDTRPRNRIAATRAIASLEKLNMEQEKRILGIPDTIVNVVQQVNLSGQEVAIMHASIPTPAQAALAAIGVKQNGNGNGSNGNGNGNGHTP